MIPVVNATPPWYTHSFSVKLLFLQFLIFVDIIVNFGAEPPDGGQGAFVAVFM